ncbi:MAG: OsmC family peroxiredoxin, partial [Rikenellaceae bacterium]|nr:OsmC family peroxiredoxin [Rikenellaceae bacterium]
SFVIKSQGIAARTHNFSIEGTTLEITKVMSAEPRRIGRIEIKAHIPHDHDAKTRAIIERAAATCPVEHSLHPDIERVITFDYGK